MPSMSPNIHLDLQTSVYVIFIVLKIKKLKVEKFLQEQSDIKEIIEAACSSLLNEKMSVKSWKVNELVFYDKQLEVIEERVKELNNFHTKISTNALTLKFL